MPPRPLPKILQILVKTHKLIIFTSLPQGSTILELKAQALSALNQFADAYPEIPAVTTESDFEISRARKERGSNEITYQVLAGSTTVKDVFLNWEEVYLQFRNQSGELQPVQFTPIPDGDE